MSDFEYPYGSHWTTPLDCGHLPTTPRRFYPTGAPFSLGYGILTGVGRVCYDCAEVEELKTATHPDTTVFHAYPSKSGTHGYILITWTGGRLATAQLVSVDSRGIHYWRATTPDGRRWYGKNGGLGMTLTMRLSTAKSK